MPTKKIKRLPLYASKDFYAVCIWESIFAQRMAKRENQSLLIRRILDMKRYGKYSAFFKDLVHSAKEHFGADTIAVIPGNRPGLNQFQRIMDNKVFVRIGPAAARKYSRETDQDSEAPGSLVANLAELSGKVLLVDDVITTGKTMGQFAAYLEDFHVIKFAFAINHKLNPTLSGEINLIEHKKETKFENSDFDLDLDLDLDADLELDSFSCEGDERE
ncbi:phosphoribosyltransferase [Thermodesulfobacteriota bacterium]